MVAGVGAGAAALLSLSSALYEAAHPEKLPVAAAGDPVDNGRFMVALLDAKFGKAADALPEKPAQLVVEMEFTNRSAETSNAFMQVINLVNPPADLQTPSFYLARDNAIVFSLHPNMPERIIAKWDWPKDAAPPQSVEFKIAGQFHKRRDNLYGAPGWFDKPPVAKVVLPVKAQ